MKKIRVLLGLIVVMALVGGALAFKATKTFGVLYCTTTKSPTTQGGFCDVPVFSTTIGSQGTIKPFTTDPVNGECVKGVTNCPTITLFRE